MRRAGYWIGLGLAGGALLWPQAAGPAEYRYTTQAYAPGVTFNAETNLVQAAVLVRDGKGNIVTDLGEGDFEVLDSRVPQAITAFNVERAAPAAAAAEPTLVATQPHTPYTPPVMVAPPPPRGRAIVFYLDDVNGPTADLLHAKAAVAKFLTAKPLAPGRYAVGTVSAAQPLVFGDERAALAAVNAVTPHPRADGGTCPQFAPYEAYLIANQLDREVTASAVTEIKAQCACTILCDTKVQQQAQTAWDAFEMQSHATLDALLGTVNDLGRYAGDKALVLASSGFLTMTLQEGNSALEEAALRRGVVIDALDSGGVPAGAAFDLSNNRPAASMRVRERVATTEHFVATGSLAEFAAATGGSFFEGSNDLPAGLRAAIEPPAAAYFLGFTPAQVKADGKYHALTVRVLRPGKYTVQARPGYYAPAPNPYAAAAAAQSEQLRAAVAGSSGSVAIAAQDGVGFGPASANPREIEVTLLVKPAALRLPEVNGAATGQMIVVAALYDAQGDFVTGREGDMTLALSPATLAKFGASGLLRPSLKLAAPPGTYRLREVIQALPSGLITASSRRLVVP